MTTQRSDSTDWACRGGKKQHLLRIHAPEIVAYVESHGFTAAMTRYHVLSSTLQRVLERHGNRSTQSYLRDLERTHTLAQVARQEARTAAAEVRQLRRDFGVFSQRVAEDVATSLVLPVRRLLESTIRLPEGLASHEEKDPLSLADLAGHGEVEDSEGGNF